MGGTAIRLIDSKDEAGLSSYVRIRNEVTPDNTDSLDQLRWETATYPGQVVHLLAEAPDGLAVGGGLDGPRLDARAQFRAVLARESG